MIRAHTYSAVLRDPASGQLAVGVQSHWFNVGRIVPWARAGVGAVATQSLADPMYGPRGLDLMDSGKTAPEALAALLAADEERETRQVAFVDASGAVAAHTGSSCIAEASHITGEGWSVQANIMRDDTVVPAMAAALEGVTGDAAERVFAALEAAEDSGGDLRGSQSAALVVAGEGPVPAVDLRIEDHPSPIPELRRLLTVHRAYEHMTRGDDALGAGHTDTAATEYAAAAAMAGDNPEVIFWQGLTMASSGDAAEGAATIGRAVEANPDLLDLLRRLPASGLLDGDMVAGILDSMAT